MVAEYLLTENTVCGIVLREGRHFVDTQLKRGILEVCVLAELCRGQSYGYRIQKDLARYVSLSESALYHILKRQELAGQVQATSVEHEGRLRRMYSITEKGRARLTEFREQWQEVGRANEVIEKAAFQNDEE